MDIDKNGSINTKDSKKLEENNASRILDEFPPWKEFTDRKIKLFTYFRTRKAIYSGEPVWEYSKDELEKNKFLPPWGFNLYQSFLSAIPGAILASLISFIFVVDTAPIEFSSVLNEKAYTFSNNIRSTINSIWVPISMFFVTYIAAHASFKKHDATSKKLTYARRAYLYFDGALGLWPETIIAATTTLLIHPSLVNQDILKLILAVILIPALLWQNILTNWKIPRGLFVINGYSGDYPKFGYLFFRRDENSKLWRRYKLLGIITVGIVLYILMILLELISVGAGYLLAKIQMLLQSIVI